MRTSGQHCSSGGAEPLFSLNRRVRPVNMQYTAGPELKAAPTGRGAPERLHCDTVSVHRPFAVSCGMLSLHGRPISPGAAGRLLFHS